jgi:aryl-phospho-beta-D-glucosidase BglC (GH1 family)
VSESTIDRSIVALTDSLGHSGTSAGQAKLWSKDAHLKSTSAALRFLASHLHSDPSVVGLQLINEPEDNRALEGWYKSTLSELRSIVPAEFPLYVGDAWNADKFASWVGSRGDFVVLDTHVYRAFTDGDKRMTGEQHAHKLRTQEINDFGRQSEAAKGSLVVCEWSGALDHGIYGNAPDTEKDRQSRMFVAAELEVFEKHMAGWWWWTYKSVNWMAGWSARNATQAEILPAKLCRSYKGPPPQEKKDQALHQAHGGLSPMICWRSVDIV